MRVELGGAGGPIPDVALPDPSYDGATPALSLSLADGEIFAPLDYISLGYTHYEVWVVGASGGRGGDADSRNGWRTKSWQEVMPSYAWEDEVTDEYLIAGRWDKVWYTYVPLGTPQPPVGVVSWSVGPTRIDAALTPRGMAELKNPGHIGTVIEYYEPYGIPGGEFIGGGGGGGGLHVVSGRLDELPAAVPVVVGKEGAQGVAGVSERIMPRDTAMYYNENNYWHTSEQLHLLTMSAATHAWKYRWPNGRIDSFAVPRAQEGGAGGVSSFGDIAKASGGKGGHPAVVLVEDPSELFYGNRMERISYGGEGGIGDSSTPGGGALGSTKDGEKGKDGSWNGYIGSGGGGGRGGRYRSVNVNFPSGPSIYRDESTLATEGGRGSFSYVDTLVYGTRGPLGTYKAYIRQVNAAGEWTDTYREQPIRVDINPGAGGGAKLPGGRKTGSRGNGYDPNGAVLIRMSKIG